jgi:hypothetical protein
MGMNQLVAIMKEIAQRFKPPSHLRPVNGMPNKQPSQIKLHPSHPALVYPNKKNLPNFYLHVIQHPIKYRGILCRKDILTVESAVFYCPSSAAVVPAHGGSRF